MKQNMNPELRIKETAPIDVEGGFLINGFPSTGITSAIAAEFIINSSQLEPAAIIDSDSFPPISIIKNGSPSYPTRIFVNNDLKAAIFSSYITIDVVLHRSCKPSKEMSLHPNEIQSFYKYLQ